MDTMTAAFGMETAFDLTWHLHRRKRQLDLCEHLVGVHSTP
jgi:hypothetical protein